LLCHAESLYCFEDNEGSLLSESDSSLLEDLRLLDEIGKIPAWSWFGWLLLCPNIGLIDEPFKLLGIVSKQFKLLMSEMIG
jgi:hypothetical protein